MRSPNGFVASWPKIDFPDAGASDADPQPAPTLAGFEVAHLDARGALVRRELVVAPPELRARKGSLEAGDVAREDGATLLWWIESVTSTDPDGRVRTAFAWKGAYGDTVLAPAEASCQRCSMRVAVVAFGDRSVVILRTQPDILGGVGAGAFGTTVRAAPAFTGLVVRRDAVTARALPWLSLPRTPIVAGAATPGPAPAPEPAPAALDVVRDGDGRVVVTTDGHAWLVTADLVPLRGPVDLPATDARARWAAGPDPAVVWSIAANEDGRSTEQLVRREIFVASGANRERLSHGRFVLAADRRADELGVVFESAGRAFFALASPDGRKRGGDVFVYAVAERGSQYGTYVPDDATAIAATNAGRFTVVTLGRERLTATEIVCAP